MAWEDRTTIEAIESQFGISESQIISLMCEMTKGLLLINNLIQPNVDIHRELYF